jgi:superoxide dismutase, Cu-Zn family
MPNKCFVPALAAAGLVTFAAMGYSQPQDKGTRSRQDLRKKFDHDEPSAKGAGITKAIAVMHPTKGQKVEGTVTFTKVANGVRVQAHIHGLAAGKHGFHIHEFGDCSAPDGMSTGGHYNPTKVEHAGPKARKRHVGDLGNIEADDSGHTSYDLVDDQLRFEGPTSIIGRGLIIHEKADDFKTQPTGNAGGRVSCGVIGVAKGS